MSLTRPKSFCAGVAVLAAVWVWPLHSLAMPPFATHMVMHMAVVALAAPLLAFGIIGGPLDPVRRWPGACSAIVASALELLAVWAWHAPALHHAARNELAARALEQGTFLAAGLFLWVSAMGGGSELRRARSLSGVAGLLLTSMHMTLLGALIALTPRVLYAHHPSAGAVDPLLDQQLGGIIMLFWGALSYLVGGVALLCDALRGASKRVERS